MYDKYKKLQDALGKVIIRAKEIKSTKSGDELWVILDVSWEQKIVSATINDPNGIIPDEYKKLLEEAMKVAFEKGQKKAQEVAMEKTKEILGFDPNDMMGMLWGWAGGMKIPGLN